MTVRANYLVAAATQPPCRPPRNRDRRWYRRPESPAITRGPIVPIHLPPAARLQTIAAHIGVRIETGGVDQHVELDVGPVAMTTPSGTSEPGILDRRQLSTPSLRY
jgi:hypothetical protein